MAYISVPWSPSWSAAAKWPNAVPTRTSKSAASSPMHKAKSSARPATTSQTDLPSTKHDARGLSNTNGLNTPNATPSTPQRAGAFHSKTQLSMSTGGPVSNAAAPSSNLASRTLCRRKGPM